MKAAHVAGCSCIAAFKALSRARHAATRSRWARHACTSAEKQPSASVYFASTSVCAIWDTLPGTCAFFRPPSSARKQFWSIMMPLLSMRSSTSPRLWKALFLEWCFSSGKYSAAAGAAPESAASSAASSARCSSPRSSKSCMRRAQE
eukprot:scaffold114_cov361-Pinguiococcus_pyrenoidosus.AAC.20